MRATPIAAISILAVAALAAVAIQSRAGDRDSRDGGRDRAAAQCVSTPLRGTRVIDERTLVVDDWHGHAAVLNLTGPCVDKHTWGVRIQLAAQRDEICRRDDIDSVVDSNPGALGVCAVRSVELMSRAEAENRAPHRGVW